MQDVDRTEGLARMENVEGVQNSTASHQDGAANGQPRCLEFATAGIRTASDFAHLMSAMMSDIIDGSITPAVGNAACNAGGKLLKVVEMNMKYGTKHPATGHRQLVLSD